MNCGLQSLYANTSGLRIRVIYSLFKGINPIRNLYQQKSLLLQTFNQFQ